MTVEGVSKTGKALNAYQKFVQQKFEERRQMSPSKRPSVPEHMKAVGAEWKNRNGKNKMKFFVLFAVLPLFLSDFLASSPKIKSFPVRQRQNFFHLFQRLKL